MGKELELRGNLETIVRRGVEHADEREYRLMSNPSPHDAVDLEADRYDAAVHAELTKLRAAVAAVRELHRPKSKNAVDTCIGCANFWPCPTERAIREALGETQ